MRQSLPRFPTTMVLQERRPEHARITQVHKRGEFLKLGEPVEPGVPAVLHPLPPGMPAQPPGAWRTGWSTRKPAGRPRGDEPALADATSAGAW